MKCGALYNAPQRMPGSRLLLPACPTVHFSLGLDPAVLTKVLNVSSGRSWSTEVYNPCPGVMEGVPASRDYEGGFGTALMAKVGRGCSSWLYCINININIYCTWRGSFSVGSCMLNELSLGTNLINNDSLRFGQLLWASSGRKLKN